MRFISIISVLLFVFQPAFSQTSEDFAIWNRTGYGINELFSERDMQASHCVNKRKTFTACLLVLDTLLKNMVDNKHHIEVIGLEDVRIVEGQGHEDPKNYDEAKALTKKIREQFSLAYHLASEELVDELIQESKQLLLENVKPEEQAYLAGTHFGLFLREAYDPRSAFVPRETFEPKPRKYFGIGAHIMKYDTELEELKGALSLNPMVGSPAVSAGLVKGDLVLEVDGNPIREEGLIEAIDRIKGPEGTDVTLKIHSVCDNAVKEIVVTRGPITDAPDWVADARFVPLNRIQSVGDVCADKTKPSKGEAQALYVPMTTFQQKSGQNLCAEFVGLQIKDLRNSDSVGMIFDIRSNGGGSLDAVACMLNTLVKEDGPLVGQVPVEDGVLRDDLEPQITHVFNKHGAIQGRSGQVYHYNKNIIVLVNGGSASASEIFSGTIQDMKRGWVIGDRTVGKGSVQSYRPHRVKNELTELGDQQILIGKTIAIYTLPSGRSPQQFGVIPDFRYSLVGEFIEDEENYQTSEEKSFGSIKFKNNQWSQERPEEVAQVADCAQAENSASNSFLQQVSQDERYARPFISDYQLELAKDVLVCSAPREPAI